MATPGRLIAHLESTPGFTLRHLRFLIVDETDRLLRQAYQGWLPKVMAALHGSSGSSSSELAIEAEPGSAAAAPGEQPQGEEQQQAQQEQQPRRVVKFVVSATLTRDPSKIDRLQLTCPRYITMSAGVQQQQQRNWWMWRVECGVLRACSQLPLSRQDLSGQPAQAATQPAARILTQLAGPFNWSLQWTTATNCRRACRRPSWWCPQSASPPPWPRCCRWGCAAHARHTRSLSHCM